MKFLNSYIIRNLILVILAVVFSSFAVGTFQYFALDQEATESDRLAVIRINSSFRQSLNELISDQFQVVNFLAETNYPATALRFRMYDEFYVMASNLQWGNAQRGLLIFNDAGRLQSAKGVKNSLRQHLKTITPPRKQENLVFKQDDSVVFIRAFEGSEDEKIAGYIGGVLNQARIKETLSSKYFEQVFNFAHLRPNIHISFEEQTKISQTKETEPTPLAAVRFSLSDPKRIWFGLFLESISNAFAPTLFLIFTFALFLRRSLATPVDEVLAVVAAVSHSEEQNLSDLKLPRDPAFRKIATSLLTMHKNRIVLEAENRKREVSERIAEVAAQVAHDIRSPLTALEVALNSPEKQASEEWRTIMRGAVRRIKDITNDLYARKTDTPRVATPPKPDQPKLLIAILDQIVSEKRLKIKEQHGIGMDFIPDQQSYGIFVSVPTAELNRVISNILDNAIEAIDDHGSISVSVIGTEQRVSVLVQDDGKGIPEQVLHRVGQRGMSYDKPQGSGLGLAYCKEKCSQWQGQLELTSQPGKGTTVRINLPRAEAPSWFVRKLQVEKQAYIVIIDDDLSIHQIWRERFSPYLPQSQLQHFSSISKFLTWEKQQSSCVVKSLFLVDYELVDDPKTTGLDFLLKRQLGDHGILVTSHFEDLKILALCQENQIRLLPKALAGIVPITNLPNGLSRKTYDAVLIDDDLLIRKSWEKLGQLHGKQVLTFPTFASFRSSQQEIHPESPVYLDSDLGTGERGESLGPEIRQLGFKNIFLTTAYDRSRFGTLEWSQGIVDKSPPWV